MTHGGQQQLGQGPRPSMTEGARRGNRQTDIDRQTDRHADDHSSRPIMIMFSLISCPYTIFYPLMEVNVCLINGIVLTVFIVLFHVKQT